MTTSRKKLGNLGEDLACDYLSVYGHTILERNWMGGHLEIDIISLDPSGLHFVEVKTRTAPVCADPQDNVGPQKQRRLASAALKYLNTHRGMGDVDVFFDVVAIVFDKDNIDIKYIKQAFIPIYV